VTDVTNCQSQDRAALSAADEELLRELTERARAGGLKLTGEGGLLGNLTRMVVEGALEGELDDHLGYVLQSLFHAVCFGAACFVIAALSAKLS